MHVRRGSTARLTTTEPLLVRVAALVRVVAVG
jgi:hypothetical protein